MYSLSWLPCPLCPNCEHYRQNTTSDPHECHSNRMSNANNKMHYSDIPKGKMVSDCEQYQEKSSSSSGGSSSSSFLPGGKSLASVAAGYVGNEIKNEFAKGLSGSFDGVGEALAEIAEETTDAVGEAVKEGFKPVGEEFAKAGAEITKATEEAKRQMAEQFKDQFSMDSIKQGLKGSKEQLGDSLGSLKKGLGGLFKKKE